MEYSNTMSIPSIYLLLVSFLHILILSTSHAHSKVLCIEKEKQALLDFKLSFVEDPLGAVSTWSIDNGDCCSWVGVTCDALNAHVTQLDLGEGLKSYQLRPSLVELQHLTTLALNQNRFPMRIPAFIGSLRNLTNLDLSESEFFGEIPPQLGNLSKLQFLYLSQSNGLYSDNMQWLSRLSSIEYLDFSDITFINATDLPSTLKMLPALSEFACKSCFLPPPPLSSVSHVNVSSSLRSLDLSNCTLSSSTFSYLVNGTSNLLSLSLDYMKSETNLHEFLEQVITGKSRYLLKELTLTGNNLNKLPFEVTMFPSLMTLGLSFNKLDELCPKDLLALSALTSLDVSFNRISGSLAEILQYLPTNLTSLDVSSNLLNGTVISDAHFSNFFQLQELLLSDNNHLTFNFSKSWVPPFQLQTLSLRSCSVGPSFPNWIFSQKSLDDLDISNSTISGDIPDAFWYFSTRLSSLNLSHNKINCKIPNLSLSFADSIDLDLSSNTFHGSLPLFLFTASTLDLSNNRFTSFPPLQPRNLSSEIYMIQLSGNCLSGSLPSWLFQFNHLVILNLANNKLSGTLPREIGSLQYLSVLHLCNNRFSGQLPSPMKNCTHLTVLELASNNFSGAVPFWLGESMPHLIALTLRENNFFGDLPSTLCHLQSLRILDLSDNKISGSIPGCVHNLSTMSTHIGLNLTSLGEYHLYYSYGEGSVMYLDYASIIWKGARAELFSPNLDRRNVIDLSGNCLRGGIPVEVTTLKELRSLDLSRNNLNGSIPDKIGQLKLLEVLKLSSNGLCGGIPESLADLTFLNTLNLSNNNLSGQIPIGTQLQSLDASLYAGNPKLCGLPLPTKCPGDEDDGKNQPPTNKDARNEDDESFDIQAFLAALGMGFAFGLLVVLGILHFNRPWRLAFFQLGDNIADRTFVATSLFQSRIKRSLCFRKTNGAANINGAANM